MALLSSPRADVRGNWGNKAVCDHPLDGAMTEKIGANDASLSELPGAQYLVIAGCRSVTERKA